MSQHSVVEAKNQLSSLIDRALKGEDVVITRHGTPVVELKAVRPAGRRMTQADFDWLDSVRIDPGPDYPGAVALLRQMRDEGY
jgi:antitoxin (DNA-binding transcriptional repressor) of toxin-antitoxin stability system